MKQRAALLLIWCLCSSGQVWGAIGQINSISGTVVIHRQGSDVPAQMGSSLEIGDDVRTSEDSFARLIMVDKNVFSLNENSHLEITNYVAEGQPAVDLQGEGLIHADIHQKYDDENQTFRLTTPTAVVGVRGTEFLSQSETDQTRITTFAGNVQVGNGQSGHRINSPVNVGPGQQSIAAKGKSVSSPSRVPANELQKMRDQARKGKLKDSRPPKKDASHDKKSRGKKPKH